MKKAKAIVLTPEEAQMLDSWADSRTLPQRVVQRARLVRMAAEGMQSKEIAKWLDVSRPTVQLWRGRFLALRLPRLEKDAPRPGRIPQISARKVAAIVNATLQTTPANATHWSTRTMAEAQGVSEATVRRIRRGSFQSVRKLIDAICQYIESHNQKPKVCVWTASADAILSKIAKS